MARILLDRLLFAIVARIFLASQSGSQQPASSQPATSQPARHQPAIQPASLLGAQTEDTECIICATSENRSCVLVGEGVLEFPRQCRYDNFKNLFLSRLRSREVNIAIHLGGWVPAVVSVTPPPNRCPRQTIHMGLGGDQERLEGRIAFCLTQLDFDVEQTRFEGFAASWASL